MRRTFVHIDGDEELPAVWEGFPHRPDRGVSSVGATEADGCARTTNRLLNQVATWITLKTISSKLPTKSSLNWPIYFNII